MEKSTPLCSIGKVLGISCLVVVTSVITFLITLYAVPQTKCGAIDNHKANVGFPKDDPDWSEVDRMEIKEKNVIITRPIGGDKCYLLPFRQVGRDASDLPRPLVILNEPLSTNMLEHLAGENGAAFCNGHQTYLAREFKMDEAARRKREDQQADAPVGASNTGLQGGAWQGTGIFGSSQNQGKQASEVPLDNRQPRCSDVILDCVDHVGQVQSCYTWVNGVMWMDRKCTDSKQFAIQMTKPPGRVLKVAQQQWVICLQRRSQGLSC